MTTRIHVSNQGPDVVEAVLINPTTNAVNEASRKALYPGDCYSNYIYDTQAVLVTEKTK